MSFFQPQNARDLHAFLSKVIANWEKSDPDDRGDRINPDEPVVISTPNPKWEGDDGEYGQDEYREDRVLHFHVMSIGGGEAVDEEGNECGHNGAQFSGMEVDYEKFLSNGRRLKGRR